MIRRTGAGDLKAHLEEAGVTTGMDVVVHSRLIAFGQIDGHPPRTVLDAIRAVVGPAGTIVMPTYTFGAGESEPYDPTSTPSTNVGALPEFMRTLDGAVRSLNPVHNHCAIGPKAALLRETRMDVSMGPGSDFERLTQENFKLLLLGCKFSEGCTHLHHVEAVYGVPYREWVELPRAVRNPLTGAVERLQLRYFSRSDRSWRAAFDNVVAPLRQRYGMGEAAAPYGRSYLIGLEDLEHCAYGILAADPYGLVQPVAAEQHA